MTTPMMQQYREAKDRHPGMLLLFRIGDFYELFDDDAGARLAPARPDADQPRQGHPDGGLSAPRPRTATCAKLLHAGHRVAICDQVEDAAQAKGLVRREVTRVVTPGTLTEDDLLDPRRSNHLGARSGRAANDGRPGLGRAVHRAVPGRRRSVGTPRRRAGPARRPPSASSREDGPGRPRPSALREAARRAMAADRRGPTGPSTPTRPAPPCFSHFGVTTLAGFGFDDDQPCLVAAGALLLYLQETLKASLGHLSRLRPLPAGPLPVPRRGDAPQPGADAHPARRRPRRARCWRSSTAP